MDNKQIIRAWFTISLCILVLLVLGYMYMHKRIPGAEIITLSKDEITNVNMILFGAADTSAASKKNQTTKGPTQSDSIRKALVFKYIFSIRKPPCSNDSLVLMNNFSTYNTTQISVILPNYPIRVRSYFWLTEGNRQSNPPCDSPENDCNLREGSVYLEIIFWTLFGLIASLLYNVSEALRTGKFSTKEISVHISKFFYAPFISLVIYFSINTLTSDGSLAYAEFSHGTIVLSFILGFFSGRAIDLLNRLKELILPLGKNNNPDNQRA
jgi:hypothetical protein